MLQACEKIKLIYNKYARKYTKKLKSQVTNCYKIFQILASVL